MTLTPAFIPQIANVGQPAYTQEILQFNPSEPGTAIAINSFQDDDKTYYTVDNVEIDGEVHTQGGPFTLLAEALVEAACRMYIVRPITFHLDM